MCVRGRVCARSSMCVPASTSVFYVFCWMGGLCVIQAGLRKFLKGCGVPEIDKSRGLLGGRKRGEYIATWRLLTTGWVWLGLAGPPPSCFLSPECFLCDVYQASNQASSFSCLRLLFFDSVAETLVPLRLGFSWMEARTPARAGCKWWPQRYFLAGSRLCRRLVNI